MTKGIVFTTTGALPTGLTAGVTYWARYIDANSFHLYDTEAHALDTGSTTGRIDTSGTQSGTHTARSAYYTALSSADKLVYTRSGTENIYSGLLDWQTNRYAASGHNDFEIVHLAEAYTEAAGSTRLSLTVENAGVEITSVIDGELSEAHHRGRRNAGYVYQCSNSTNVDLDWYEHTLFGFSIETTANASVGIRHQSPGGKVIGMFVFSSAAASTSEGIFADSVFTSVQSCIITGYQDGIELGNYGGGTVLFANLCVKNSRYGFYNQSGSTTNPHGLHFANVGIGNGTANWYTQSSGLEMADYNAGESGDSPWTTAGGVSYVIDSADFLDYANDDYNVSGELSDLLLLTDTIGFAEALDAQNQVRPVWIDKTHSFSYDNLSGTFTEWERASWSGGTGIVITDESGAMEIHLTSGTAPTDDTEITGAESAATCDVNGTVVGLSNDWVRAGRWSIGPFEYDFGTPPVASDITISASSGGETISLSGAEIRIYEDAGSGDEIGDELDGTESNTGSTFVYSGDADTDIVIQIMLSGYQEFTQRYTVPATDAVFDAILQPELFA